MYYYKRSDLFTADCFEMICLKKHYFKYDGADYFESPIKLNNRSELNEITKETFDKVKHSKEIYEKTLIFK